MVRGKKPNRQVFYQTEEEAMANYFPFKMYLALCTCFCLLAKCLPAFEIIKDNRTQAAINLNIKKIIHKIQYYTKQSDRKEKLHLMEAED